MSTTEHPEAHLSIGEVLAHLQDEFPDVTVSKIRFLESQGLIDPERTPSGYRRFYGPDVDRLRWILFQQREHFLPLKIIKERLDRFGPAGAPSSESLNGDRAVAGPDEAPLPRPRVGPNRPSSALTLPLGGLDDPDKPAVSWPSDDTPGERELTRAELLHESHLGTRALDELESFGLVAPLLGRGDAARYDEDALATAQAAAVFYSHGVTARHLRMYLHFAEREADLFGQVLIPYRRRRTPGTRARLETDLQNLARSGARLRTLMLRRALRDTLGE